MPEPSSPESQHTADKTIVPRKPFSHRSLKQRITGLRGKLSQAEQESMVDHLTGLPNTKWFEEELTRRMADAKRQNKGLWVIYTDIDKFKDINDQHGHPAGDEVLKEFGVIGSREEEPIARIGGEEFAQVVQGGLDINSIQRIVSRYSVNFREKSQEILGREATLSFGIVRMEQNDTPESLRKKADMALYNSKITGRDRATLIEGSIKSPSYNPITLIPKETLSPAQLTPA